MSCIPIDQVKSRVLSSTSDLFSHAADPLADTESYPGDPGLLGPDSVSWPVIGDVAAFVAGIRALLIQSAHPEVVAGVMDHSSFRTDTLGRLSRTSAWVTATTFGAEPEVRGVVAAVCGAHRRVRGRSERGRRYSAADPDLAAWVHNSLTDSFLTAYQVFGPCPLDPVDADRFVSEQATIGALLNADPLPGSAESLRAWITEHPEIAPSAAQKSAVEFLKEPPLPAPVMVGYRPLFWAAAATLPSDLLALVGLSPPRGSLFAGRTTIRFLRWALGTSPSWHRAENRARSGAAQHSSVGTARRHPSPYGPAASPQARPVGRGIRPGDGNLAGRDELDPYDRVVGRSVLAPPC